MERTTTRNHFPMSDPQTDYGDVDGDMLAVVLADAIERGTWPARRYVREGDE